MHSLPLIHRIAGQPVIVLGEGETAAAKARLVTRAGGEVVRAIEDGIDRGARLAFVAIDDADMAKGEALRLRCRGILVNVADRPELCDFTTPSLLERGPVLIAVATGGASAGLAKALRLRLEGVLPQALGGLAEALGSARAALRTRWPDGNDRRRALDAALAPGGPLDPLGDHASDAVERWLSAPVQPDADGRVVVTLRSNDPEDLTLREARLLGTADGVVHPADVPEAILIRARADAWRRVAGEGEPEGALVVELRY